MNEIDFDKCGKCGGSIVVGKGVKLTLPICRHCRAKEFIEKMQKPVERLYRRKDFNLYK